MQEEVQKEHAALFYFSEHIRGYATPDAPKALLLSHQL